LGYHNNKTRYTIKEYTGLIARANSEATIATANVKLCIFSTNVIRRV